MPWSDEQRPLLGGIRYVRSDGAVVKYSGGPLKQQWIAYEPDPSEAYLIRYSKRGMGWPRRWASPQAAMRAVDREYPECGADEQSGKGCDK